MEKVLKQACRDSGIDVELTESILELINERGDASSANHSFRKFPDLDDERIFSSAGTGFSVSETYFQQFLQKFLPKFRESDFSFEKQNGKCLLPHDTLRTIGILLYPYAAYGILNGGSATSYIDRKKNISYGKEVFSLVQDNFETLSTLCHDTPKGITPAFTQPDGRPGSSFIELKMRSLLIETIRYNLLIQTQFSGKKLEPLSGIPLFQMTSTYTDEKLKEAYAGYRESELLEELIQHTGFDPTDCLNAVQPLIAAFTSSKDGFPLSIFSAAWGKKNNPLPLPGGHGQNFHVLDSVYRRLHAEGKYFALLGNVDNLGNTLDPEALAVTALSGSESSFEFSFKTPVDVKGGVLIERDDSRFDCFDIGPGISRSQVDEAENSGKPILFNCATGLFNLEYIVPHLKEIQKDLPIRLSNQEKDAGSYSQAEQITWEVIGLLEQPLIIGVEKKERFIAAKLLIESILTSQAPYLLHTDAAAELSDEARDILSYGENLYEGLKHHLLHSYGFAADEHGNFQAVPKDTLIADIRSEFEHS